MTGNTQRIALEPASVAETVARHAEVVDSLCIPATDSSRPLVVVKSTGYLTAAELRRHCGEFGKDAEFDVLLVDELPTVDTATPDSTRLTADAAPDSVFRFEAPQGEIETELVAAWEQVLDFTPISVVDDFVDVGGDSLMALEIAVAIARRWDVNVDLVDLVDASSVRNLATLVSAAQADR
ncbi:phosphopantetheine-binding protein [Streptomyces sp. NBC_00893]|uniref:phosphopantetheine-binding protein n=1 Tax=Streptomyces sp. NBC_00893 TaxID=2975862 RepID=UPI0022526EA9|nr:phosphopantetheine-binding protein [Streptomyces sp. NBC_00893]MCX4850450.1 phosphopantetheine-binding protein [Streptomyces sp. NBC_00893]